MAEHCQRGSCAFVSFHENCGYCTRVGTFFTFFFLKRILQITDTGEYTMKTITIEELEALKDAADATKAAEKVNGDRI